MGSSGSFLKSRESDDKEWEEVGKIAGVKIIRKKGLKKGTKGNLPFYSNTPGTAYVLLDIEGKFSQYRQYGENRKAIFDIDYGRHNGDKSFLHMHVYDGAVRSDPTPITNTKGDIINEGLYERYKKFLKGIKL